MKLCALLAVFASIIAGSLAASRDLELEQFLKFEKDFNKFYQSAEERDHRITVFRQNLRHIQEHNSRPGISYTKGINQFTDLTGDEFKDQHLRGYVKTSAGQRRPALKQSVDMAALPMQVDWRDSGVVSPVKDQGNCGSCWAFATIEQVESYMALETGNMTHLSVQELVSCMPNVLQCGGYGGCFGAVCEMGFQYIQLFGLVAEDTMPYMSGTSGKSGECKLDVENMERVAFVRGYETLPHNDMAATMHHLATVGPLAIALDASKFHMYEGGVFDDCAFDDNIEINHGVQLIGYGNDPVLGDYWLIRNSWGASYGEDGYIRVKRQSEVTCGIDSTPAMGVQCKGDGFDTQKVCGTCGVYFSPTYPIGAEKSPGLSP